MKHRGGGAAPLIVALHGCTQTPVDFAAGTRLDAAGEAAGAFVLYPQQAPTSNPQRCWNWFLRKNQSRGGGEPAAILSLVERTCAAHPIDRSRIFVTGLSAGGAMAAILAEQAPDVFAAVGIMAGVPLHAAHDLASAGALMAGRAPASPRLFKPRLVKSAGDYGRTRASLWAGADDRVVAPINAEILAAQFRRIFGVDDARVSRDEREDAAIERWRDERNQVRVEVWRIAGMGHAWSGGSFRGSHTYPAGPKATDEMMRFFLDGRTGRRADGDPPLCGVRGS